MLCFQNFMAQHSQLYLILIVKTVRCQKHTIITVIAQITAACAYVANTFVIQSIQSSFRGRHFVVSLSRIPVSLWQKMYCYQHWDFECRILFILSLNGCSDPHFSVVQQALAGHLLGFAEAINSYQPHSTPFIPTTL